MNGTISTTAIFPVSKVMNNLAVLRGICSKFNQIGQPEFTSLSLNSKYILSKTFFSFLIYYSRLLLYTCSDQSVLI